MVLSSRPRLACTGPVAAVRTQAMSSCWEWLMPRGKAVPASHASVSSSSVKSAGSSAAPTTLGLRPSRSAAGFTKTRRATSRRRGSVLLSKVAPAADRPAGADALPGIARTRPARVRVIASDELQQRPSSRRRGDRFAREAQPLSEDCEVRPRDCAPMHGRLRACSESPGQQTAMTAVRA